MTTIMRFHQSLHQLPLLKHSSIVQAQGLHPVSQSAARVTVQHISPILLIHRHHLTLHALRPRHRLPKTPGPPVVITVEAEGVGRGLAELSEALFAVNVVRVSWNQQTARLELDAVTWAQSKSGPFCKQRMKVLTLHARWYSSCKTGFSSHVYLVKKPRKAFVKERPFEKKKR